MQVVAVQSIVKRNRIGIIAFPSLMRYTKILNPESRILTPDSSKPKALYLTTMGIAIIPKDRQ